MNGIWYTHTGGFSFQLKLSMGFILIALLLVVWFYLRVTRSSQRQMEVSQWITDLRIQLDDVEFTCKGLIDTGNRLYDPLTNMPVMVVEVGFCMNICLKSGLSEFKMQKWSKFLWSWIK